MPKKPVGGTPEPPPPAPPLAAPPPAPTTRPSVDAEYVLAQLRRQLAIVRDEERRLLERIAALEPRP